MGKPRIALMITFIIISLFLPIKPSQPPRKALGVPQCLSGTTISSPGHYKLCQNYNTGITIQSSNVILDLNGYTIQGDGSGRGVYVYYFGISLTNITVLNGTIRNFDSGVEALVCNSCSFRNLRIENTYYGIYLNYVSDITVENNYISTSTYGIMIDPSNPAQNVAISYNTIEQASAYGMYISGTGHEILCNTVTSSGQGIRLSGADSSLVEGNNATGNQRGIVLFLGSDHNIVRNNLVNSNTEYGVYVSVDSRNNTFYLNNFINNSIVDDLSNCNYPNRWYDPSTNTGNYWENSPFSSVCGSTDQYPLSSPASITCQGGQQPTTYTITYILTVNNRAYEHQGARYFGEASSGGNAWTVELTDPDGDGNYTGSISGLSGGDYSWRIYLNFTHDGAPVEHQVSSGTLTLSSDQQVTASFTWASKNFTLTVENTAGEPSGVSYWGRLASGGLEWVVQLAQKSLGVYEGVVGGLVPGTYSWEIYYILNSTKTTISSGTEPISSNHTNTASYSWPVDKVFRINLTSTPSSLQCYGNASYDGQTWMNVQLQESGSTLTGTLDDLQPTTIQYRIYCVFGGSQVIFKEGAETLQGSTYANQLVMGRVTGTVFNDTDYDGVWDPGEPPLAGWLLTLYIWDGSSWVFYSNTTSDASGSYAFENLGPGNYRMVESVGEGMLPTTFSNGTYEFSLAEGGELSAINFGNVEAANATFSLTVVNPGGALPGTKYYAKVWNSTSTRETELADPDGDGTYLGSIGMLYPGTYSWEIYYVADSTRTTVDSGTWLMEGEVQIASSNAVTWPVDVTFTATIASPDPNATYYAAISYDGQTWTSVQLTSQDGTTFTGTLQDQQPGTAYYRYYYEKGGSEKVITEGTTDLSGGSVGVSVELSSISGLVFNDGDGDGQQDPGEVGLEGLGVRLYSWNGSDWVLADSATTNGTGGFEFRHVPPDTYRIYVEPPAGWTVTSPQEGYYEVTTSGSNTYVGYGFGLHQSSNGPGEGGNTPQAAVPEVPYGAALVAAVLLVAYAIARSRAGPRG